MSRKNQSSNKPKYGAQEIRRIVAEGEKTLGRGGELDDPWLYVAAVHAFDLFDVQKVARVRLDFTGMTQDGILGAVVVSAMILQKEGRPEVEVRQVLAKRLAAYTMFQVYNDLSEMGLEVGFDCGPTSYALVAMLPGGESISFNFLGRATFALRRFLIGEPGGGDPFAGGTLQPFFQGLYEGFLRPAFVALGMDMDEVEGLVE